jgi:hypothetical protein
VGKYHALLKYYFLPAVRRRGAIAILDNFVSAEVTVLLLKICRSNLLSLFLALLAATFATVSVAEEELRFTLPVYAWVPNYDFELPSGQKGEITQDDILSNLDMAFMAQPRLDKGRWSLVMDFVYMDLSNKDRSQVLPFLDLRQVQLQEYVITPTVGYQVYSSGRTFVDIYGGARYIWIEPTLKFQRQSPLPSGSFHESESADKWDGVVGVRGNIALGTHWSMPYAADAGTGQSDYVVNLMLGVAYHFSSVDAVLAYRYLDYDFGDDWVLKTATPSGPLLGVVFKF